MRKLTRREYVLMGVLLAATLIVVYSLDTGIGVGGGNARKGESRPLGAPPAILMDAIYAKAEEYGDGNRDLFLYGTPPLPKGQPARVIQRPKPKPRPEERQQKPVPPPPRRPAPVKKAQPPEIRFKYVGYLGPKDGKIAVFAEGDDMILARTGDVVKDEFKVLEFRYESVLMGYTDARFRDKTTEVTQER